MESPDGAKSNSASATSTPGSNGNRVLKVPLAEVKRRLEAEKRRLANIKKSRLEEKKLKKAKSPKASPTKPKVVRRSIDEAEAKRKRKPASPPKTPKAPTPIKKKVTKSPAKAIAPNNMARKKQVIKSPCKMYSDSDDFVLEEAPPAESGPSAGESSQAESTSDPPEEAMEETSAAPSEPAAEKKEEEAPKVKKGNKGGFAFDTEFGVGFKLEAKDINNDWYPARVMTVDHDAKEVLVHFEGWSNRYDEWISMDNARLRPSGELSQQVKTSKVGSKGRSSTSTEAAAVPEDNVPSTSGSTSGSAVASTSAEMQPESASLAISIRGFKVNDEVMASWSDSRKYPAKIVEVLENDTYSVLFFDGFSKTIKGSRISAGHRAGLQVIMQAGSSPGAPPTPPVPVAQEENIGSKADRRERKRKLNVCELYNMKPRGSPPVKTATSKTSESSAKSSKTPGSPSKSATSRSSGGDGPPPAKRSRTKSQQPKLQSPGQEDLMLIESMSGSTETKGKGQGSTQPAGRVRTLLPKGRSKDSASSTGDPPPPHNPIPRIPPGYAYIIPEAEPPPPPPAPILEGMQVEMEGDNFKCPSEGCNKLYRKEIQLQLHIKHYHPELKSRLVVVPKVLDLAYARTVGDLPSTATTPRNSSQTSPATPSTSTPPSQPRKRAASQATSDKSSKEKVDDEPGLIDKGSTPMTESMSYKLDHLTPPPLPPPSSSSFKTGTIKTLLPVHRKTDANAGEGTSSQQPLSALQQALMSPPGHLTALLNSPLKNSPKSTPKNTFGAYEHRFKPTRGPRPRRDSMRPLMRHKSRGREEGSPNKELVNCSCGVPEEDGLMIQCDLCMCWQHGLCNAIETEEEVPEKYVCYICLNPARERMSRKYSHDQDWLKEGVLPRMPIRRNQARNMKTDTEKILKETYAVTAAILRLQEVIHSLRVKINIAEKADHPKLYLWSKRWEEESKLASEPLPEKIECKLEEPIMTQEKAKEEDVPQLTSESVGGVAEIVPEEIKIEQEDEVKCSQGSEDSEIHPALKLPLSHDELQHLASTVEHKLRSAEESQGLVPALPAAPVKAPEPEAPIQPAACRLVLLEHIERLQSRLEARLDELERRLEELEAQDPELAVTPSEQEAGDSDEPIRCTRTKETLRMLQRDLGAVKRISDLSSAE